MPKDKKHTCKKCKVKTDHDVTLLTNHLRLICKVCNTQELVTYEEANKLNSLNK